MTEKTNATEFTAAPEVVDVQPSTHMATNEVGSARDSRSGGQQQNGCKIANSANSLIDKARTNPDPCENVAWPTPQPFAEAMSARTYPLDALPPAIREAVIEVQQMSQAPLAMVASAAITVIASAAQGLANVCRDGELIGPISLMTLTIADSGERKSFVDKLLTKSLRKYDEDRAKEGDKKFGEFKTKEEIWTSNCERIKAQMKNSKGENRELEQKLEELHKNRPERELHPKILALDVTTEKLMYQLANEWPSCAIFSAEGAVFLGSRSMTKENQLSTLGVFNSIWSNESVQISRKTCESFALSGVRLSLSLSVQPDTFAKYIAENSIMRDIGFWARFLFSYPESTQGTRFFKGQPLESPGLDRFHVLVTSLLNTKLKIEGRKLQPPVIRLGPSAKRRWIEFHDHVEGQIGKGGNLCSVRDFASKIAENAARLAAVFQLAQGVYAEEIDAENMEAACKVAQWHLDEVQRYFGSRNGQARLDCSRAQKLEEWLVATCRVQKNSTLERSWIMQRGPSCCRKAEALNVVLDLLIQLGRIRTRNGRYVEVNPKILLN